MPQRKSASSKRGKRSLLQREIIFAELTVPISIVSPDGEVFEFPAGQKVVLVEKENHLGYWKTNLGYSFRDISPIFKVVVSFHPDDEPQYRALWGMLVSKHITSDEFLEKLKSFSRVEEINMKGGHIETNYC